MRGFTAWAGLGVAVTLLAGATGVASASTRASAAGTVTTTSGSWSAVLVDAAGAEVTGRALAQSWTISSGSPQYVSVRNNGSLPLTAQTYTLQVSGLLTSVTATACVGGTWSSSGACSGSAVALGSTASSSTTAAAVPLAVGASVPIKVTSNLSLGATSTLTVRTARSQTRAATTRTS